MINNMLLVCVKLDKMVLLCKSTAIYIWKNNICEVLLWLADTHIMWCSPDGNMLVCRHIHNRQYRGVLCKHPISVFQTVLSTFSLPPLCVVVGVLGSFGV